MNSDIKDQLTEWVCSPDVVVEDRRVIIHSHLVRWINTSSFNYHFVEVGSCPCLYYTCRAASSFNCIFYSLDYNLIAGAFT